MKMTHAKKLYVLCVYMYMYAHNLHTPAKLLGLETAERDLYTCIHHSDCPETCHLLTVHTAHRRETLARPPLVGDQSRQHAAKHCTHHKAPSVHHPVAGERERERERERE